MLAKRRAALLVTLGVTALAPYTDAAGWQELHETSDDVRLEVGPDGLATVEHHLRYRIVAGRYKTFELAGIHPAAELAPEAVFTSEKGGEAVLARVEPVTVEQGSGREAKAKASGAKADDGDADEAKTAPLTARMMIDEGKGLGRGSYTVDVRYKLDLVATKMLTRDGALWRLAWTAPPAPEGHDGARVVFDVPSAPTEPRPAGAADSTTLATLRRSGSRDELELVRAHVPRGEAVTWAARLDPKALAQVTSPDLRPPRAPEAPPPSLLASHLSRIAAAACVALLAGALAALLREKQRAVRAASAIRAATPRPLLPIGRRVGPVVYGLAAAGSLACLLWGSPLAGAGLVILAMAVASHRASTPNARPRGPGRWRPVSDPRLLASPRPGPLPTDALDVGTARGRLAFAAIALGIAGVAWLLRAHVPQIAIALPLASAAIVPVFFTGTRAQMPPSPTELAARVLRPARDALEAVIDLEHADLAMIGRVVERRGGPDGAVDEVRPVCAPRDRTPGLRAIELALATTHGGHGALPEVFVRFDAASAAAARVARVAAGAPIAPGRTAEERVVRLAPEEPSASGAAALVGALVLALEGRRASDRAPSPGVEPSGARWTGHERRGAAVARVGLLAGAAAAP